MYLIPVDEWYIIPYKGLGKKLTLHFRPDGGRQKYRKYREAWHLLEGEEKMVEIFGCADEECRSIQEIPTLAAKSTATVGHLEPCLNAE